MRTSETKPTRRNVVAHAAAVLPWAAIRGTAANSAVSVGLLGTGNRGPYVAGMLAKNTPGRVTALCDLFPEKMERAKSTIGVENPKTYTDLRELLKSDVDAVIIATPVYLHPEHLEAAIKAGKHIYIEKPAGADVEGCKRVMRLADSADRKLNITFGFQRRYAAGLPEGAKSSSPMGLSGRSGWRTRISSRAADPPWTCSGARVPPPTKSKLASGTAGRSFRGT